MILRNYQDKDFPQLKQLLLDTDIFCESIDTKDRFQNKRDHDPASMIVAEKDNKIIGTVFIIYDSWNSFVHHLGVHPDHQGQGIANALMDEAENRLKKRGIDKPTILVEEENEQVLGFYEKRGWSVLYKTFCLEKNL